MSSIKSSTSCRNSHLFQARLNLAGYIRIILKQMFGLEGCTANRRIRSSDNSQALGSWPLRRPQKGLPLRPESPSAGLVSVLSIDINLVCIRQVFRLSAIVSESTTTSDRVLAILFWSRALRFEASRLHCCGSTTTPTFSTLVCLLHLHLDFTLLSPHLAELAMIIISHPA